MRDLQKFPILEVIHHEINYYLSQYREIASITLGHREFYWFKKTIAQVMYDPTNTTSDSITYHGYTIRRAKKAMNLVRVNCKYTSENRYKRWSKRMTITTWEMPWSTPTIPFGFCKNPLTSQEKVSTITAS